MNDSTRAPDRGFIFDLDGTLADTMATHFGVWQIVAQRHGLTFPEPLFYELAGMPSPRIAALLVERAGLALDAVAIAHEKEQAYVDGLLGGALTVTPIEPIIAIARACRAEGALAIASGGSRRVVTKVLTALGIADWFAAVVASEDTARHKPEPDVFLEAARRLGVAPAACTVYEDADLGLEAARRAGMKSIDVRVLLRVTAGTSAR